MMAIIDQSIRNYAVGKPNIDQQIRSEASIILQEKIRFVPSPRALEAISSSLKGKYTVISSNDDAPDSTHPPNYHPFASNHNRHSPSLSSPDSAGPSDAGIGVSSHNDGIPDPQFEIYRGPTSLEWLVGRAESLLVGLHNTGNTCFLNSVLQVLTHTAPLVNYLIREHDDHCPAMAAGICAMCELRNHVQGVMADTADAVVPSRILQRMRCFMKTYLRGRQEDAHEFLRFFVDSMQVASLFRYKSQKLDMYTKGTSPIGKIFGGYHRSEITCLHCNKKSTTYDPFLDISLEVKGQGSVEEALKHFTKAEMLCADNAYKCPNCRQTVKAKKMYTIHRPPNILTLQLKRFDHFGKITQHVRFGERLHLQPYLSTKEGAVVPYRLFGVIVHHGNSTHSGHYYAFVRNQHDDWHIMDDSRVCPVPQRNVLNQPAYMLFYARQHLQTATVKPRVVSPSPPTPPFHSAVPKASATPTTSKLMQKVPPIKTPPADESHPLKIRLISKPKVFPSEKSAPETSTTAKSSESKSLRPLVPYEDDDESASSSLSQSPDLEPTSADPQKKDTESASDKYNVFRKLEMESSSKKDEPESGLYAGLSPPRLGKRKQMEPLISDPPHVVIPKKKKVSETPLETSAEVKPEAKDEKIRIKLNLKHGTVEHLTDSPDIKEKTSDTDTDDGKSTPTEEEEDERDKRRRKRKKEKREEKKRRKKKEKEEHKRRHRRSDTPPQKNPADFLEKYKGHGYGPSVASWGGGRSHLDREEERMTRPRQEPEEDPSPRMKKHRTRQENRGYSYGNNFQRMQNRRNVLQVHRHSFH